MIEQNIKVLLIEDNLDYAQLIKRILSKKTSCSMEVEHHDSFSRGYERASRGGIDLIHHRHFHELTHGLPPYFL